MIGIDTNVLVRYITQDDPKQSAIANNFIEKQCTADSPGFISLIALIELVWVSEACYDASKTDIVTIVQQILSTRQLLVQESETVWKSLQLFQSSSADFSDCLLEQIAIAAGCSITVTFDKKAAKAGMKLLA